VPVQALGDGPAYQRPGRDAQSGDAAPDPDDRAAALGGERGREQGEPQGHHDRCAEPLDGSGRDQDPEVRRESTGGRGQAEQRQPYGIRAASAEPVTERGGGDDPGGEGERVGVDDPGQPSGGATGIGMDGRQGGDDDERVQGHQQVGTRSEQHRQPSERM
jgi:hypothetical protein